MKPTKKPEDRKVKISITLSPDLNKKLDDELINKSRIIEKLLREYYGKKYV
jgi:metal-responsive CopG/Arc/MetJ family transcriptional regulator